MLRKKNSWLGSSLPQTLGKAMQEATDYSDKAFRELVRVLEEAVQAGANSVGLEYEGRDLIVYHNYGNTGLGNARIPQELQQAVIEELVRLQKGWSFQKGQGKNAGPATWQRLRGQRGGVRQLRGVGL
jgi:hypothetical protein